MNAKTRMEKPVIKQSLESRGVQHKRRRFRPLLTQNDGFQGITLAYNVANREQVQNILQQAVDEGAKLIKPAQDVFWGGYSGYFADPDGHLWEVA
jgi:uncharacterized glyoxalase superfamily protein PhnB